VGTLTGAVPAAAQTGGSGPPGSTSTTSPSTTTSPALSGSTAVFNSDGSATAPAGAPRPVRKAINAANRIRFKPYRWGGGHRSFNAGGYDCSGAVSYALHGGGLLRSPLDSSALMSYGRPGPGRHITIYANSGHAFMVVNGRSFDTSNRSRTGTRWSNSIRSTAGYVARHPAGL